MKYRVSKGARRDLDHIFLFWAGKASPEVADRIIDSILERFWMLGEFPESGRTAEDIAAGVRCFPAGKYLIYYRVQKSVTEILHIFHGSRRQRQAFRRSRGRR